MSWHLFERQCDVHTAEQNPKLLWFLMQLQNAVNGLSLLCLEKQGNIKSVSMSSSQCSENYVLFQRNHPRLFYLTYTLNYETWHREKHTVKLEAKQKLCGRPAQELCPLHFHFLKSFSALSTLWIISKESLIRACETSRHSPCSSSGHYSLPKQFPECL